MPWIQVKQSCDAGQVDAVEEALLKAGAVSVTLVDSEDKPLFEPAPGETPLWDKVTVVGLFSADIPRKALEQTLSRECAPMSLDPCSLSLLEDQDWERVWLEDFKPLCFGGRLWVCPSGQRPQPGAGVIMELDPGLAFGTGTHPTTALCLEWLAQENPRDLTLIDYGCGSGILGIAALLLGAGKVYGVDNDPQALAATAENCRKNAISPARFPLALPGAFAHALAVGEIGQADGVLANILAAPLVSLAQYLSAMVRPGGFILLSGILEHQAADVMAAYAPWFEFHDPVCREDWVRITGTRLS